jgi:hypothetical protein
VEYCRVVLGISLLLTVSLLAAPAAGQATNDTTGEWRTLAPSADAIDRANHTSVGTDLSAVLERDAVRYEHQHRGSTLDVASERAGSDSARFDRLSSELERIESRLDDLTRRQHTLTERYGNDRIDGRLMLTRLATIEIHAEALERRLVTIRTAGRRIESRALVTRANDRLSRVQALQGTVRAHVAARQRGAEDGGRVYAEAGNRSLVLATATGQDYLREVSVPDRRQNGGTAIGLSEAVSIVGDAYPELYAARQSIEVGGSRRVGLFRVAIAGTGEFLTTYVDADSRAVFREDRRVSLARVPLSVGPNTTTSDYRLATATTYRGGPMRVSVQRTDGEPVDAQILIGDASVGSTGADGSLWATAPARTTVQARVDGASLSVPLETSAPPPLNTTVT